MALDYKSPERPSQHDRQLTFWRVWAVISTGLLLFATLILLSTGPRLWWLGFREMLRQWFG